MVLIHFSKNAADPLTSAGAAGATFVPLADGAGDTHLSCLHLKPGGAVTTPSIDHAATLLVVHGRITVTSKEGQDVNLTIHAGMGCVVARHETYAFQSDSGAIVLIVESTTLTAHPRGVSSPERIAGATWPSDSLIEPKHSTN